MKRFITAIALSFLVAGAASATSSYSGSVAGRVYAGSASSSSQTTGGSQFGVSVNSNGKAAGSAESTGGGTALAGVKFTGSDVKATTDNTSYATGDAKSHISGSATGTGSAAQGTDTASAASGQFGVIGANFAVKFGH